MAVSASTALTCLRDAGQTDGLLDLQFKLSVDGEASETYDEAQVTYTPKLDTNRDRALIDQLPDFLVEEIQFPRAEIRRFYVRVTKALNERAH
jgi:hypothetical protein